MSIKNYLFSIKKLPVVLGLSILYSCGPSKSELAALGPTETFPEDTFLKTASKKKALVVVAHDDDLVAMSGTLSRLNKSGWEVNEICFISESPERDSALVNAAGLIMSGVEFIKISPEKRRNDVDSTTVLYKPIPKEKIREVFNEAELTSILTQKINAYDPEVIFTLDNEIGGYGHPEHVLVSQLVLDLYNSGNIKPGRIYQSVYPNSMEKKILEERLTELFKKWGIENNSYLSARALYNIPGMPEPNIQVNIKDQSEVKMKFLRSFLERERKTIAFFVPMFEDFDHEEYFEVFDREFFRVISKDKIAAK